MPIARLVVLAMKDPTRAIHFPVSVLEHPNGINTVVENNLRSYSPPLYLDFPFSLSKKKMPDRRLSWAWLFKHRSKSTLISVTLTVSGKYRLCLFYVLILNKEWRRSVNTPFLKTFLVVKFNPKPWQRIHY